MPAEEGEYLAPAIHRLLGPIKRPVPIEEAVAGPVVPVEFVSLAVLIELGFVLTHLLGAWRPILGDEWGQGRAAEVLRHVDRRDGRLGIELLLAHHHAPSPQLNGSIDIFPLAGIDEGVAATRARAEKTNLAVMIGLRAHPLHPAFSVPNHLRVSDAALGARLGGDVIRITVAASTLALVEVGTDREMAVMREPTRRLDIELAPAREMVDKHDARKGART